MITFCIILYKFYRYLRFIMCKGEDLMHQAYKKAAVLAIITLLGWGGIHSYYLSGKYRQSACDLYTGGDFFSSVHAAQLEYSLSV